MTYVGVVRHDKLSAAAGPVDVVLPCSAVDAHGGTPPAVVRHGTTTLYYIRPIGLVGHLYTAIVAADAQQFVVGEGDELPPLPQHQAHPAATPDVLLPAIRVWQDGTEHTLGPWQFRIVDTPSRYERVFVLSARVGPLHVRIRQRVRTLDPIVELDGICFTMDGAHDNANLPEALFRIDVAWPIPWTIDNSNALGVIDYMPRIDEHGFMWRTLCADLLLTHGQQWAAWGCLLASNRHTTQRDWARMGERVTRDRCAFGVADWAGYYLPFGGVPIDDVRARESDTAHARSVAARMLDRADYFGTRALGLAPYTGQTGGQDDFGACKGFGVLTMQQPEWIGLLRAECSEPLRPIHYLEPDGEPILLAQHPEWFTWSQCTHPNKSASPDRLGMDAPRAAASNRWSGKDESHLSSNRLHVLHRVTGSWMTADWIADEAIVGVRQIRMKPGQGSGPVRSIGRRVHQLVLAYLDHSRDDRQPLASQLVLRLNREVELAWETSAGVALRFDEERTVRILGGPYVDARKLVDPVTNEPRPTWVVWEHALALLGLSALHALQAEHDVLQVDNAARLTALIAMTATTILEHGVWIDEVGQCHYAQDVAYNDGLPLPLEAYVPTADPSRVRGVDRSFHDWMAGGIAYALRVGLLRTQRATDHAHAFLAALDGWRSASTRFRRRDAEAEWTATHG